METAQPERERERGRGEECKKERGNRDIQPDRHIKDREGGKGRKIDPQREERETEG